MVQQAIIPAQYNIIIFISACRGQFELRPSSGEDLKSKRLVLICALNYAVFIIHCV